MAWSWPSLSRGLVDLLRPPATRKRVPDIRHNGLESGEHEATVQKDYRKVRHVHRQHRRDGFVLERRNKVPSNDVGARAPKRGRGNRRSPYRSPASYGFFLAHVAILAVIGWVGWNAGADRTFTRPQAWLLILVLMAAFALLAGRGITGYWRGILIDQRNKMSLSRLQLLVWTLVILSAIVTIVLTNVALGSEVPLALEIPRRSGCCSGSPPRRRWVAPRCSTRSTAVRTTRPS